MPKNKKPVINTPPLGKNKIPKLRIDNPSNKDKIPPSPIEKRIEWSFSFKYFKQIDNFGLGGLASKWFIALLERLKTFSGMEIETFLNNYSIKNNNRFHQIDWEKKNVPIRRTDFDWIDPDIINNPEEIPFYQFHVSQALGRIVGFLNENSDIFYIILLDPKHNIQPSRYTDYKIRSTDIERCHYSSLLYEIERLKRASLNCPKCHILDGLNNMHLNTFFTNGVLFFLEDDYLRELKTKLENERTLSEIIELGIACN